MDKLIEKPYLIFLVSIPAIMLIGFINKEAFVDINVHDTYLVISQVHLAIFVSIVFGIIGIGYWGITKANRKLAKGLSVIHMALTFGGFLIIFSVANMFRTSPMEYEFNNTLSLILVITSVVMLLAQILVPVNIIYALTKNKPNPIRD